MAVKLNGTEDEVVRSSTGGLNGRISGRYDLIDPRVLARLAAVLEYGATKYTPYNWMLDPPELHLSHVIEHLGNWNLRRWESEVKNGHRTLVPFSFDGKEDEVAHALCRLVFLMVTEMQTPEELAYVKKMEGISE